jgi:FkbM family methyltransferase
VTIKSGLTPASEPPRLQLARLLCRPLPPLAAGRIGRRLYPFDLARRDRHQFTVRAKTGSAFTGNAADVHAYPLSFLGWSEWRNWSVALAVCPSDGLIVEIGANVGTETVGFSDIAGAHGRVMAFEPLPAHLATLRAVISGLRHANVTLLPYALSDRAGRDAFAVPGRSMSQGIGHLLGPEERATGTASYYDRSMNMDTIEVQIRRLDDFASDLRGLSLLVADAEGAEIPILRGAARVLASERPILVLEASQPHQRRAGFSLAELRDELSRLGYVPYEIQTLSLTQVRDPAAAPPHSNWLCVPTGADRIATRVQRVMRRCALSPCTLGLNPLTRPAR